MKLGIFAKTFARESVEEVLDAVQALDLKTLHFNYACAGLPSLPDEIPPGLPERIGEAARQRELEIGGVSATFNLIHPDPARRAQGLAALDRIGATCRDLRTRLVTLCTGTRDPDDMWRAHPGNLEPDAWHDLRASLDEALEIADRHEIVLGIEPESGNVIDSASKARRLLDEIDSPRLRIVLDPANLVPSHPAKADQDLQAMSALIDEAFDLLGSEISMAHAKEFTPQGLDTACAIGRGLLDWERYLSILGGSGFKGPLIMHGFHESCAGASMRFLRNILES